MELNAAGVIEMENRNDELIAIAALSEDARYDFACVRCGTQFRAPVGFCLECNLPHTVYPRSRRIASEVIHTSAGMSAKELAARSQRLSAMPAYGLRFGRGSVLVISGWQGYGKSCWGIKAGASIGSTVLVAAEEGHSESLAEKLRFLEVRREDFWIVAPKTVRELVNVLDERKPRCLIVDSIQATSLIPADLRSMAQHIQGLCIVVSQVNKSGVVFGCNALLHEADIVLEMPERLKWRTTKHRFGPLIAGEV